MPVLTIPIPNGGLADESSLAAVPKDKAFLLQNFLVDQPGLLRNRGPLGSAVDIHGAGVTKTGVWVHGENILSCGSATTTAKFYDTDGGGAASNVALTDATRKLRTGKRSARLGAYAYGPSNDTSVALLRWAGTAAEPTVLTHAPRGAADVATHLNRLFVAGGTEPNTASPATPNTLWWTDVGGPATNTLADWQDDVSGLVNELVIGDDGESIVALAPMANHLLVFKTNSIWAVFGNSPSSFSVRKLVSTMGGSGPLTTLVVDDLCLFTNNSARPYAFDGVELIRLSNRSLTATSVVRLPSEHVLWIGSTHYMLYLPSRAWTTVAFDPTAITADLRGVMTETGAAYILDDRYIRSLQSITGGGAASEANRTASANVVISCSLIPRAWPLTTPEAKAVVERLFFGHSTSDAGTGTGTPSWTVSLLGLDLQPLASTTIASSANYLQQAVADLFAEANHLVLQVAFVPSGGVPDATAQVESLHVEWRPAQRKGST